MPIWGINTCRKSCELSPQPIQALPSGEIVQAVTVSNIRPEIADDGQYVEGLKKLGHVAYINKRWINKRSVGPERLSLRDNRIVLH